MPLDLYSVVYQWQEYGLYDILLPFLLVFTLAFAILEKTKILGSEEGVKKLNIIIALVVGFLFLQNTFLIQSLQVFLPNVSFVLVILLLALMIVGIFTGGEHADFSNKLLTAGWIIAVITIIWALFSDPAAGLGSGNIFDSLSNFIGYDVRSFIIPLILLIAVIAWVTSSGTPRKGVRRPGG